MRHHPPGLWRRLGEEEGDNQSGRVGISRRRRPSFSVMAGLDPAIHDSKRIARHLDLHTNTVHFRLNRIRDLTGIDPRSYAGLPLLLTTVRMMGAVDGTRTVGRQCRPGPCASENTADSLLAIVLVQAVTTFRLNQALGNRHLADLVALWPRPQMENYRNRQT
jgi:hypothetical protein